MGNRPLARSRDLIIEELGEELLVYDTDVDRAHSLSPEAAKVWRSCNGNTSAEELGIKLGIDVDTVVRALDELSGCDLLDEPPTLAPVPEGSTRREATIKMVKVGAAVAAAPLIVSVAAPTPGMAATIGQCTSLTASGNCGNQPGGCGSVEGCCCCIDPISPPYPAGSPCKACQDAGNCGNQQCKTCVPCDQDTTLCPTFCNDFPVGNPNRECHVKCSSGDCPDTPPA